MAGVHVLLFWLINITPAPAHGVVCQERHSLAGCADTYIRNACGGPYILNKGVVVEGRGRIVGIDRKRSRVTLRHESIDYTQDEGTSTFFVDDIGVLKGVEEGEQVVFHLRILDGNSVVIKIEKPGGRE